MTAAPTDADLLARANRQRGGARAYRNGVQAEANVETHYHLQGCLTLAKRWRGPGAEIDLIFRDGDRLIFVEVKAGRDHDAAVQRVRWDQLHRIFRAAEAYAGQLRPGKLTELRIDVALVDRIGAVQVLENVSMAA
ncbi:YraN family protein [Pseudooceanicola sp. HF7]|uniref:YraN family protein n=1 Tax=Pseudooceanicola sp. HF7 TaxID=2721560 RepID=UPI001431121A|nr:YraN family protein [Pseudooceanicola sp. HF7]NIZ08885.1 hypothetical protein [Pseudooceanicola sp. HF7]